MSETERMLAEVFVTCPVCFAIIHRENRSLHWDFHLLTASQMAYGMAVVQIDKVMKDQGVTWPGDVKEPEKS